MPPLGLTLGSGTEPPVVFYLASRRDRCSCNIFSLFCRIDILFGRGGNGFPMAHSFNEFFWGLNPRLFEMPAPTTATYTRALITKPSN